MPERTPPKKPIKRKGLLQSKSFLRSKAFKITFAIFMIGLIAASSTLLYFYVEYSRIIDRRLSGEVFKNTARIYATPFRIYPSQKLSAEAVVGRLQKAGYETADKGLVTDGSYEVAGNRVTIRPASGEPMRLDFQKERLAKIVRLNGNAEMEQAYLPAEMVTNLFDESRTKRRVVDFKEIPPHLVNALIAAEDRRFYSHFGVDPIRLVGAIVAAVRHSNRVEGTSTITQQLARNYFLSQLGEFQTGDRSPMRKVREMFVSVLLEQRLTKQQIITMYANEVYLGNRGSFAIHGFGEGAATIFGKDIGELTISEAAMMASIIPSPNTYSPIKYPDRARNRRNLVLSEMLEIKAINDQEYEVAKAAEIKVAPLKLDGADAPYLVDYIRDSLAKDFSEQQLINDNLKIYSTLDPDLQKAAVDAVEKGLKVAQAEIAQKNKRRKPNDQLPDPQASLIALDPHTGEITAMVGGTIYGVSQYNRITQAFRQPGSIFKPFVYAAAFEQAFDGADAHEPDKVTEEPAVRPDEPPSTDTVAPAATQVIPRDRSNIITTITTVADEPTVFANEGSEPYEPNNYHEMYRGSVTVREALWHSLNIPTIKIAERIGYNRVAELAQRAGMNAKIKPYPSIALGAFEVTPIEMAGAYTIFANQGQYVQPHALVRVTAGDGKSSRDYKYEPKEIIRPELAYLMTHLMEGVLTNGTAMGVRGRGFALPAAGKTGTSRDGWFAGYTKDLLVIAWVGYDDNRDLNVEGAHSALPIWTEFMIRAYQLYPVADPDAMYFEPPSGIDFVRIDKESLALAGPSCPDTFEEAFISGTAPANFCPIHGFHPLTSLERVGKGIGGFFKGLFGGGDDPPPPPKKPQ